MITRKARLWLLTVLMVISLLVQPAPLQAQCNVTNTVTGAAGTVMYVIKSLSMSAVCMNSGMMASFCTPTAAATFMTMQVRASAMLATMNPYCSWACDCGTGAPPHVVIGTGDGLPVELMEFSVEDEEEPGDEDAGQESGATGDEKAT